MQPLALYVPPALRRLLRRIARRRPRNLMRRDASALDRDVRDALARTADARAAIARLGLDCRGLHLLEIGPGHHFGPQLLLAGLGARLTLADRFLAPWNHAYHPAFYQALREAWAEAAPALDRVIAEGGYDGALRLLPEPAERLAGIADGSIDLVLSNSVCEHVFDLPAVCRELARVTRLGGCNHHTVDFRWHRVGFARPLEFLLHSERRFRRDFAADHGECGNRWRAAELAALFRGAGFEVLRLVPHELAADAEIERVLPRLRRSRSPYRDWPEDDLRILSASFELRRTDDPAVYQRGRAEIDAQARHKAAAAA